MRISDWSSDVCSSDLDVVADHHGAGLGQRSPVHEAQVVAFDVLAEVLEGDAALGRLAHARAVEIALHAAGERVEHHDAGMYIQEIGRASGRERVGQYV